MQNTRKRVIWLGYVAAVLCAMAVTASYAWMSISSAPTVTDLALSVVSDNTMELAPDEGGAPGEWGSILDLSELSELKAPLTPITFSASEEAFFAPVYGWDGRVDYSAPIRLTDRNGALIPSSDLAENGEETGTLYRCEFWIRSGTSDCSVSFAPAAEREDGQLGNGTFLTGEPYWDAEKLIHIAAGNGAEKAVRMALRIDGAGEASWILFEPSAADGSETMSVDGKTPLQGEFRLVRQSAVTWKEKEPVLKDEVSYSGGTFLDDETGLFALTAKQPVHVTLYLWLEGQDPDCTNVIAGGRLLANLQFAGEAIDSEKLESE